MARVYRTLQGRRYLIVLDDMWHVEAWDDMWHVEAWDDIRRAFPHDENGSRIIISTRLSRLAASFQGSSPIPRMKLLSDDHSWNLLKERTFGQHNDCPHILQRLGKIIARSCKGLPIAIIVIAGLLKVNMDKQYWKSIAQHVCATSAEAPTPDDYINDEIFYERILTFSYNNLPHHLRPCFLQTGVYPEDHDIPAQELIKMWVAEGYLKPDANQTPEDVALDYLDDLVQRNLVMVKMNKYNNKIKSCSIHDTLRELSLRQAEEENFLIRFNPKNAAKNSFQEVIKTQRRMSIETDGLYSITMDDRYDSPPVIRSLVSFGGISGNVASSLTLLRLMHGLLVKSQIFSHEICGLVHIRYLAFIYDYNDNCQIPASIARFKDLQTLMVARGSDVQEEDECQLFLLLEIWRMPQLRHLVLMNTVLPGISPGNVVMENLQTLSGIVNFKFTKEAVERLPHLKRLSIHYRIWDSTKWPEFHLENLAHLEKVEELTVQFHPGYGMKEAYPLSKDIFFPQSLKKLTLVRSGFPWKAMSAIGLLPKLEVLKLRRDAFVGRKWEPTEGEFLQLRNLQMRNLDLKIWSAESTHFRLLKTLHIGWCSELKEIPMDIGEIDTLQTITLEKCNLGTEVSAKMILQEIHNLGNEITVLIDGKMAQPSKEDSRARAPNQSEEEEE